MLTLYFIVSNQTYRYLRRFIWQKFLDNFLLNIGGYGWVYPPFCKVLSCYPNFAYIRDHIPYVKTLLGVNIFPKKLGLKN